jgi:hypothetical protein
MNSVPLPAPPSVEEVARIIVINDPVILNLRITECYHRLALGFTTRTGLCANWCTFATWASRQAGRTIRGEDFLERLAAHTGGGWTLLHPIRSFWRALLRRGIFRPDTRLGRLVREIHSPFDAFERASAAVARGNRKVFEEIGFEFARYLQTCPEDALPDSERFRAFLQPLRTGAPPDGQDYLRRAFTFYQRHRAETNPSSRAQLILLANLLIGLHEQTRLQPEIREALESVPDTAHDLGARTLAALFPGAARLWGFVRRPITSLLSGLGRSFHGFARDVTRRTITESLMVLSFPADLILSLGRHLDYPPPDVLQNIDHAELGQLLNSFEPQATAPDNCGAEDWGDLGQRMHFIVHLFRAFHGRPELFEPPFTIEQIELIMSGIVPQGRL